ncbi:hypothetical protein HI914_07527 [Erysiphe necator]|nr:hypothetical protein HI914_07527 [Erysiphe necator]
MSCVALTMHMNLTTIHLVDGFLVSSLAKNAKKEDWEDIWVYGFFGSLAFGVVGYAFKPDTSIQTWALEEARRRLEIEGILEEPQDSHIKKP